MYADVTLADGRTGRVRLDDDMATVVEVISGPCTLAELQAQVDAIMAKCLQDEEDPGT
jgi:hypothetical protein